MKHCLFFFLLILPILIYAQRPYKTDSKRAIKLYEDGLASYNSQLYPLAEQYLKEAIKADQNFQNAYLVLAEVCWDQQKYTDAIRYYDQGLAIDSSFYPKGYLNKGKLEMKIARYADALASFQTFVMLIPDDPKNTADARRGIRQAKFAMKSVENPVEFKPENLGPAVNTRSDEYWPSLSADGQMLVITRLVEIFDLILGSRVQEDFFFSKYEDSKWSQMKNAGPPLNSNDNEGAQSISADGKMMVYTVCNRKGVIGRCDLYYSEQTGDDWSEPENMGEPVNTVAKETQPGLSADGRTLYFVSDRPGGKGGLDIWVTERNEKGIWSQPENLGDSVNTPGDEMSPFIHQDNQTLYFASESHIGMGGFDIFITRKDDTGGFKEIRNLGYPINTSGDEFGLIVNARGDIAYYASDADKTNGKDIYQFTLYEEARPEEVSYLKGKVYNEETLERLRAEFVLLNLEDGSVVSRSFSDERTGEFLLCIPTNRNYMLNVDRKGYLFYSDNFSLEGIYHLEQPFIKDVPLKPLSPGGLVILNNIFFETDSYALRDESKYELDKILRFLTVNQAIRVEISGHTDNTGGEAYNISLSENRAASVVKYLINKGIEPARLSHKGYGYSVPVDTNDTPEGRANNRRTELKILE